MTRVQDLEVLDEAIRAWVGFDLDDDQAVDLATARALDLYGLGASVQEACAYARSFVTRWLDSGYETGGRTRILAVTSP